eukprot:COSAG04_NODE_435_length_14466_cov_135.545486_13_plen_177_part_00
MASVVDSEVRSIPHPRAPSTSGRRRVFGCGRCPWRRTWCRRSRSWRSGCRAAISSPSIKHEIPAPWQQGDRPLATFTRRPGHRAPLLLAGTPRPPPPRPQPGKRPQGIQSSVEPLEWPWVRELSSLHASVRRDFCSRFGRSDPHGGAATCGTVANHRYCSHRSKSTTRPPRCCSRR